MALRLSLLLAGLIGFSLSLQAQDSALPDLPELQSTVPKVRALNEGLTQLKNLQATLKNLGSPIKREKGEKTNDYLKRVDRILKGRAYALELMGSQVEQMLIAKYQLQEQLDQYEEWANAVDEQLQVLPEKQRKRSTQLEEEFAALKPDGIVLAYLIHKELVSSEPEEAKNYEPHFSGELDDGRTLLESVADRQQRESKFAPLSLAEKKEAFEKVINQLVDKEFEIELLNKVAIVESEGFRDLLPKAHHEVIQNVNALLKNNELKMLDDKAAQLSILAKYAGENLNLVQQDGLEGLIKLTQGLKTSEPVVNEVMNDIFTNNFSTSGRRGIMLRSSATPATPETTNPEE